MSLRNALGFFAAVAITAPLASAAINSFTTRAAYNAALGAPTATENFSGFAVDTPFRTSPVAASGFTIVLEGAANTFRNQIDVAPIEFSDNNGTANASCFVNRDTGAADTVVRIGFTAPVAGFGGDFYGVEGSATGVEGLVMEAFNGATSLASFPLPDTATLNVAQFFGVVGTAGETITSVRLSPRLLVVGTTGEGFGLDDVTLRAIPEPCTAALCVLVLAAVSQRRRAA